MCSSDWFFFCLNYFTTIFRLDFVLFSYVQWHCFSKPCPFNLLLVWLITCNIIENDCWHRLILLATILFFLFSVFASWKLNSCVQFSPLWCKMPARISSSHFEKQKMKKKNTLQIGRDFDRKTNQSIFFLPSILSPRSTTWKVFFFPKTKFLFIVSRYLWDVELKWLHIFRAYSISD